VNPTRSFVLAAMIAAILMPLEGGAVCSSYTPMTDAALVSISDGIVEGYDEDYSTVGSTLAVRFASVSSGNAYTCKSVSSYQLNETPAEQEKLNDQIRRAAILSMTLGYKFSGRITDDQFGRSRLTSAGVSK
jgi:hypothetical protein